ncbi:hypothetical protein QQX98_008394 [Neonectria punicea]|uniref:Probable lysosomal cobalamin transporter n=1 Tax=Neonectria punicea TaxID=979145 RepID=A0ABR1GWF1_9HYPO
MPPDCIQLSTKPFPTKARRVYRIRGVPHDWGISQLEHFLAQQKDCRLQDDSAGPIVSSLTNEVWGCSRVGTVTLQGVPAASQTGGQWTIPLPLSPSSAADQPAQSRQLRLTLDDGFHGITPLYSPLSEDHKLDILAISGLGGHAFGSFKQRGGDYMWVRDSLPQDLILESDNRPTARVMIYGYDSSIPGSKSMQSLEDLAASFHSSLLALVGPSIKPVILVAHSLGGLIVKQTLISLSKSESKDDKVLLGAVYGVVFFGVPHDGMDINSLIPMVGDQPNRFLVESIGHVNSQILSTQRREFHPVLGEKGESEVFCFYETLQSPTAQEVDTQGTPLRIRMLTKEQDGHGGWAMTGPPAFLVTKSSATHCRSWEEGPEHMCPISRSHSEMVKFAEHDAEYDKVVQRLAGLARRAIEKGIRSNKEDPTPPGKPSSMSTAAQTGGGSDTSSLLPYASEPDFAAAAAAAAAAAGLALVAAILTVFTLQAPRERSAIVTVVAVVSLTATLATVLLLPVDIALVSSTVSASHGAKKDWATPERVANILLTLKIIYYSLYSFDALLCLLVIPFSYFWYEEYDEIEIEEGARSVASRVWGATKHTLVFVALIVILFLVGFFVPAASVGNSAHWDFDYFKHLPTENKGEKALTFTLGLLVTVGTLFYIVYTGTGMALLPMSFINSVPSISALQHIEMTASALEQNRERQRQIEMRNSGLPEGPSRKDQRALEALVREEQTLVRRGRLAAEKSGEGYSKIYYFWLKFCAAFRPIKLLGGVFILLISLLLWVSILITGIDKATNSICMQRCGYILSHINIFQPINWFFLQSSKAFPIDYILLALLVLLLFGSSILGITTIGIRIFQIHKGQTAPQALLIATAMLALITLAINYVVAIFIAPQYSVYGTQSFCTIEPRHPGEQPDCTNYPDRILPCSEAPAYRQAQGVCTPSVMSTFLNRIAITWPFFGAVDFWAQFAFLGTFLVVFVTTLFRTLKLNLSKLDEDAEAEEGESLLASVGRRFGAT